MSELTTSVLTVTCLSTIHIDNSYSPLDFNFVPPPNLKFKCPLRLKTFHGHFPSVNLGKSVARFYNRRCYCMHFQALHSFFHLFQADKIHLWYPVNKTACSSESSSSVSSTSHIFFPTVWTFCHKTCKSFVFHLHLAG